MNALCLANKFNLLQGNLSKFYKILERNVCLVLMIATSRERRRRTGFCCGWRSPELKFSTKKKN
jgi:hypothetical protein